MDQTTFARNFFETQLKRYWAERYKAYTAGQEDTGNKFLSQYLIDLRSETASKTIPPAVIEAYDYYYQNVQAADWGNVYGYQLPLNGSPIFAVRVTTDGDDGWLELFDEAGKPLGAARTYLELVSWGATDLIRSYVQSGGFPPELDNRETKTLWGK